MRFYNDLFDDFFGDNFFEDRRNDFRMDISDEDKDYKILAQLPGIKKDEISLNLEKDILTVEVKLNKEENEEKDNFIHREIVKKDMKRSVKLENVDYENISATLNNGILEITVPKKVLDDKKKIEIQ
ncbi:MAG: Hsp20 family protein [Peptoniphilaceae bacterium]|nr:Hsp20 family protein [Peptoniphilaceae bacterium]MDD7383291.1 Hsp20 family protein [Peptoniphilaceae bacterium]MDY3738338.1 Hsp20 family protein [Peptoniphilaceae bacterium]